LACAFALASSSAFAALGQPAATISQDGSSVLSSVQARQFAQATQAVAQANVTVQTVQSGPIAISEYVRSDTGEVFAIRYAGPYMPNLQQLLGQYFPIVTAQNQQAPAGRPLPRGPVRDIQVTSTDPANTTGLNLVVHEQGFMGSFTGYAYDPTLLPQGFDISNLSN
jgi:hypothetical protein